MAVHVMTRRPSNSEGVHRAPLGLDTMRPHMGREVGGRLRRRQRQISLLPAF